MDYVTECQGLIYKGLFNGFGLCEGGDFTTNVHTKHTLQIYDKLSYEELNRHFCQTAVLVAQLIFKTNIIQKSISSTYFIDNSINCNSLR